MMMKKKYRKDKSMSFSCQVMVKNLDIEFVSGFRVQLEAQPRIFKIHFFLTKNNGKNAQ